MYLNIFWLYVNITLHGVNQIISECLKWYHATSPKFYQDFTKFSKKLEKIYF